MTPARRTFVFTWLVGTALLACVAPARPPQSEPNFTVTDVPVDRLRQAARTALLSDGFRELSDEPGTGDGHLGRIRGRRPSTALAPTGIRALVDFSTVKTASGDAIAVHMWMEGSALVLQSSMREELERKLKGQIDIAIAERDEPPVVDAGKSSVPAGPSLPPFTGVQHALIIGISEYSDPNFSNLRTAESDARALEEFLKSDKGGRLSANHVHVLVNEEATRKEILKTLVDMASTSRPGEMILLYFAGHAKAPDRGNRASRYLMPVDGDATSPEATGISKEDVRRHLDPAEAKRQILLLDCCFAGDNVRGDLVEDDPFVDLKVDASIARTVITSTKGSETALDSLTPDDDHSPFAASLLRALRGEVAIDKDEDRQISTEELYDHLYSEVTRSARTRGTHMHPQMYGPKDLTVLQIQN